MSFKEKLRVIKESILTSTSAEKSLPVTCKYGALATLDEIDG